MRNEQPNLLFISTEMKQFAKAFEEYIEESASAVSGETVVDAYGVIKRCKKEARRIWKSHEKYEIALKPIKNNENNAG